MYWIRRRPFIIDSLKCISITLVILACTNSIFVFIQGGGPSLFASFPEPEAAAGSAASLFACGSTNSRQMDPNFTETNSLILSNPKLKSDDNQGFSETGSIQDDDLNSLNKKVLKAKIL